MITLNREKKIVLLRWLQQGCIDTNDIEEMHLAQRDLPVELWKDWEEEYLEKGKPADFDIIQRINEAMGMLPSMVTLDTKEKKLTVLRWLKRGYIDTHDFSSIEV